MELIVAGLDVRLGGRTVLRGVDAMFRPGRITAILGPNGAGKSSLVKTMAALITPVSGSVQLGGRDVATLAPRERARSIGYLPQDGRAYWDVPVRDVVALGRLSYRSPFAAEAAADRAAIAEAMRATGTTALAERGIATLSGGERARVLLARTLAGTPDWLLADEPLAALDPSHQFDMLDRLRAVATAGRGVVIVLHDLLHAGRVADDVLLLRDGRVVAHGPVLETMTAARLSAVFDIAVSVALDAHGRPVCIATGRG
ncbi:ABC transporter ATP-binding protein [Sphingomonas sp. TREG-RG-20F-R18-01]|uniref:ABC transporter ATP-binding protein n=1 Tax=Sphingomonas sp. TREG-RG-20F-R18-01 TaxID=2914982 RepID=UPI001F57C5EA|nr:ABC transporter ATP-binding protein [Sphingomonas sp. TREG-RG-20F-R18-01]